MTRVVGPNGQVVIPKPLRDKLDIQPGDAVDFWQEEDHIVLAPSQRRESLYGRLRGQDLTGELLRERALDGEREGRRLTPNMETP
jgi:AbrB family looped-hinge helix DNA binding protein